ncbi:MAG: hypothetical protein A2033_04715 [Bacteroidetes bacterium GWA2_31_9]|nr:MAG: hypothetical protein A2033_04715 [Bacteroidetes bacterium GWA2_31_9]
MPTIYLLNSIKIDVYSREHLPPHFHAIYAEYEILIRIDNLDTLIGNLPQTQYRQVIDWAKKNQNFLMNNFKILNHRFYENKN